MNNHKPYLIAEIGCVHIGSLERAKKLIKLAASNGADIVKFQKRNPEESTPEHLKYKPHPNPKFSYGDTYLEHRKNLELDRDQHEQLKRYCEEHGVIYSSSVWDLTSAKEICSLNPYMVKIPSACNHRQDLINYLYNNFDGQVHISLGMTTKNERRHIIKGALSGKDRVFRTVFYHCISGYPVDYAQMHLLEIKDIKKLIKRYSYPDFYGSCIGFSNHGKGLSLEIAALSLGAIFLERHFIDTRDFLHTDAIGSIEPSELQFLKENINNTYKALTYKPTLLEDIEQEQRAKLRG